MLHTSLLSIVKLVCLVFIFAAIGCAGHSIVAGNPFAGAYDGDIPLGTGAVGTLDLTVSADGTTTGTLTVQNIANRGTRGLWIWPSGGYSLFGTTNSQGSTNLSGDINEEFGGFTIVGDLPHGNDISNITIEANGNTYSGTVEVHTSTGSTAVTFSPSGETNAHINVPWSTNSTTSFQVRQGYGELNATDQIDGDLFRIITVSLPLTMQVGDTVTLQQVATNGYVMLNESRQFQFPPSAWASMSGTVKLVARTGTSMEVELTNVRLEAFASPATGALIINGTVKNDPN